MSKSPLQSHIFNNNIGNLPKLFILVISFIGIFVLGSYQAYASIVSLSAPKVVTVGERISVDVLLDPENISINSIESTIKFPSNLLAYNGFSAKQSSIPMWVEEPREKTKGAIYFSGVIPGGMDRLYDPVNTSNSAIPIVRLFFIAKTAGTAQFTATDSQVLQNDGKGTATSVTNKGMSVLINPGNSQNETSIVDQDVTTPEKFEISIIERSVFGKTPRLAVFTAEDSEGGIEYYEVSIDDSNFEKASSPVSLPYRLFSYTLTARAYDYSGNFQEQQITVPGERPYGLGIGLLVLFLIFIGYRFYTSRKRKV